MRETQTGQSCSPNVPQLQLEGSHDFVYTCRVEGQRASCRAEGESELTPTRIHNGPQHIALNIFGAGDMLHDQHSAP